MNKPNLAIVVKSLQHGGGVAKVAREQALQLSHYFDVTLFSAYGVVSHPAVRHVRISEPSLNWMRRFGHVVRECVFGFRVLKTLKAQHNSEPIDFVLFHGHGYAAIAGTRFKKATQTKFGVVVHGDIFSRPKGTYDSLLTRFYKWSSFVTYREAELVVSLSPNQLESIRAKVTKEDSLVLAPNGVFLPELYKEIHAGFEGGSNLLWVGRLSVEKDPITLILGLKKVARHVKNVKLTIVGEGPLRLEVETLIANYKLEANVELLGQVSVDEVARLCKESDVFCITSISDPLPTVVLEAMSFGLPVVGSSADGIPFLLDGGKCGQLFIPGDSDEFARVMIELIENPARRIQLGKAGRARVEKHFSWPQTVKIIAKRIESIVG